MSKYANVAVTATGAETALQLLSKEVDQLMKTTNAEPLGGVTLVSSDMYRGITAVQTLLIPEEI